MKPFLFAFLSLCIINCSYGQAVNKYGQKTVLSSTYVNQNGAMGISGLTNNGAVVYPINNKSTNALDFDGGDDYVLLPAGVYFNGDFTIQCWVY